MPPRGRGRPRTGLKRIDAAIDAMLPLGFTTMQVRKCVKELLKEYGGDDGWPFIEDCAYSELIAALLRDAEIESKEEVALDNNQTVQDQNPLKEKSGGEEELAGPSNIAPNIEEDDALLDNLENVATDGNQIEEKTGGEEELVGPSNITPNTEEEAQQNGSIFNPSEIVQQNQNAMCLSMSNCELSDANGGKDIHDKDRESPRKEDSPRKGHSGRCRQFYGWIDRSAEDDDDDDDFIILPPSSMVLGPPPHRNGETRKRRSRWDVSPYDR